MNNPNYTTITISNLIIDKVLNINIPNHLIIDKPSLMDQIGILNGFMLHYDRSISSLKIITINNAISKINKYIERSGIVLSLNPDFIDVYIQSSVLGLDKLSLEVSEKDNIRTITINDSASIDNELLNAALKSIGIKLNDKSEDSSKTYSNDVDVRLKSKFNDQDVIRNVYQPILDLKEIVDEIESKIKNNMEGSNGNNIMNNKDFNKFAVTPIKFNESPTFVSGDYKIEKRPIEPVEFVKVNMSISDPFIESYESFIREDKLPGKDDDSLLTMQAIIENDYHDIIIVVIPDEYRFPYNYNRISNKINAVEKFYNKKGIQVKIIDNDIDLLNHLYRCGKYVKEIFTFKNITDNKSLELIKYYNINIEHLHEPVHHKVVTLCGSRKFIDEFIKIKRYFSKLGWIVNMPASFDIPEDEWCHMSDIEIENFHSIHNQMMENSDLVYIVTKNGYYGENTRREIEYCEKRGIPVQYHNMILD